ncbi:MAG: acyltransferase family protein [Steroidobacteraceae bacterium]|jgi:peptidoglycan/LPS O-acetylase OafA/YrhL
MSSSSISGAGGSADSHVIGYRPDVDGLRAIAVLAVVFYHLSRQGLAGGYLGVDMFFVLSGYLITAIIWRETQEGRFSIVRFYDRRIRRIVPALLLVLVTTTAVSAVLLLPSDLVGYAKSLLATLIFCANVYFWRDTNYFSAAAEQKPLLHLWSLGVEEQFYILFPLILILLARWCPRRALFVVAGLSIVSLVADMMALRTGNGLPAFFLLPTRAWELGVGACIALLPSAPAPRERTADLLATFGALLVVGALVHPLDSYWFFPVGLPAVVGTALLIVAGNQEIPLANRLLRLRAVVFVGLISYSLYLWHWPVIVLSQYYLVRPFTPLEMAGALGLMGACAALSWRFVERPFRSKTLPTRKVRLVAVTGALALAAAAVAFLAEKGLPGRLSAEAAVLNQAVDTNYRCALGDYLAFGASRACTLNLPSLRPADAEVVLLGNSHAQMYAPVWASILAERGQAGLLVPLNGCLPTVEANISTPCVDSAKSNLDELSKLTRARTVIIGLNWDHGANDLLDPNGRTLDNRDDRSFEHALDDLIDRLQGMGKRVVLIGPIAKPGWSVASVLSRQIAFGHEADHRTFLPASDFEHRFGALIRHFAARNDISFVRPDEVQCPADRCYYVLDGRSLFADDDHIATAELPRFRAIFEAALPPVKE